VPGTLEVPGTWAGHRGLSRGCGMVEVSGDWWVPPIHRSPVSPAVGPRAMPKEGTLTSRWGRMMMRPYGEDEVSRMAE